MGVQLHITALFGTLPPVPPAPPVPLMPSGIMKVAVLFKAGGDLCFDNYISRAESADLELETEPPTECRPILGRVAKDCCRSVNGGALTARQNKPLDIGELQQRFQPSNGTVHCTNGDGCGAISRDI